MSDKSQKLSNVRGAITPAQSRSISREFLESSTREQNPEYFEDQVAYDRNEYIKSLDLEDRNTQEQVLKDATKLIAKKEEGLDGNSVYFEDKLDDKWYHTLGKGVFNNASPVYSLAHYLINGDDKVVNNVKNQFKDLEQNRTKLSNETDRYVNHDVLKDLFNTSTKVDEIVKAWQIKIDLKAKRDAGQILTLEEGNALDDANNVIKTNTGSVEKLSKDWSENSTYFADKARIGLTDPLERFTSIKGIKEGFAMLGDLISSRTNNLEAFTTDQLLYKLDKGEITPEDVLSQTSRIRDLSGSIIKENEDNIKQRKNWINRLGSPSVEFDTEKQVFRENGNELQKFTYPLGENLGSIASNMAEQGLMAAKVEGVGYGLGKVAGMSRTLMSSPNPYLKVGGAALFAASSIAGLSYLFDESINQGAAEGRAEAGMAYSEKVAKESKAKFGFDVTKLTAEKFSELTSTPLEESKKMDEDDRLYYLRMHGSGNPEVDELLESSRAGLKNLVDQNVATTTLTNSAQLALAVLPLGSLIRIGKTGGEMLLKAITPKVVTKLIAKAGTLIAGSKALSISAPILKNVARLGVVGFSEGLEEGSQFRLAEKYKNGDEEYLKDKSFYENAADGYANMFHVARVITGNKYDPMLSDNKEFWENVKVGAQLGVLMGGGASIMSTIKGVKEGVDDNLVQRALGKTYLSQLNALDDYTKGVTFANRALRGKEINVEAYFNRMKDSGKLPKDITDAQFTEEKEFARHIMSVSKSGLTKSSLDKIGVAYDSEDHQSYMGLYAMRMRDLEDSRKKQDELSEKIDYKSKHSKQVLDAIENHYRQAGKKLDQESKEGVAEAFSIQTRIEGLRRLIGITKQAGESKDSKIKEEQDALIDVANQEIESLKSKLSSIYYQYSGKDVDKNVKELIKDVPELVGELSALNMDQFALAMNDSYVEGTVSPQSVNGSLTNLLGYQNGTREELTDDDKKKLKSIIQGLQKRVKDDKAVLNLTEDEDITLDHSTKDEETDVEGVLSPSDETSPTVSDNLSTEENEAVNEAIEGLPTTKVDTEEANEEVSPKPEEAPEEIDTEEVTNKETGEKEEVITEEPKAPTYSVSEESDRISRVFFYDPVYDKTPQSRVLGGRVVLNGKEYPIENGVELGKALADPKFLDQCDVQYHIEDSKGKGAVVLDKLNALLAHYDSMTDEEKESAKQIALDGYPIRMILKHSNGKVYAVYMRAPFATNATTKELLEATGETTTKSGTEQVTYDKEGILALRRNRVTILKLYAQTEGKAKIYPSDVRTSVGTFEVQPEARSLTEIPGLNIPKDKFNQTPSSVEMGIVSSHHTGYKLTMLDETKPGMDGIGTTSGAVYVVVHKDGEKRPMMVDAARFSEFRKNGKNPVVDLIYQLAVKERGSMSSIYKLEDGTNTFMTPREILHLIVNYGPHTIKDQNKTLSDYQFFYDAETGVLHVGQNQYNIENISDEQEAEIKKHIEDKFHWNTSRVFLTTALGQTSDFGLKNFFTADVNKDKGSLTLIPDVLEFSREDVGLTQAENGDIVKATKTPSRGVYGVGYMLSTGKFHSRATDKVLTNPFIYAHNPVAEGQEVTKPTVVKQKEVPYEFQDNHWTEEKMEQAAQAKVKESKPKPSPKTPEAGTKKSQEERIAELKAKRANTPETKPGALKKAITRKPKPGATKLVTTPKYTKADTMAEVAWLYDVLGLTENDIQVLQDVIKIASNGTKAMGVMTADSILLWENMEEGTAYHEAFHRVSLMLLSKQERERVYNETKKNNPQLKTNREVEEFLAEEFRSWMLTKRGKNNSIFARVYNAIKAVFNIKEAQRNALFNKIADGKFKNAKVNEQSLDEFKTEWEGLALFEVRGLQLESIANSEQFDSVVTSLTSFLLDVNNIKDYDSITVSGEQMFDALLEELESAIIDEETPENVINTFLDVVDNYGSFVKAMSTKLTAMGINISEKTIEYYSESDRADFSDLTAQIKDDNQVSVVDKANPEIRFFMSGIQKIEKGEELRNPYTNLPERYSPMEAWNKALENVSNVVTYEQFINTIKEKANTDTFFSALLEKIEVKNDDNFNTLLYVTLSKYKNEYVEVAVKKTKEDGFTYDLRNANSRSVLKRYPKAWSTQFALTPGLYGVTEDGRSFTFNSKQIIDILTSFERLTNSINKHKTKANYMLDGVGDIRTEEGLNKLKEGLVSLLSKVGITVDVNTISSILEEAVQDKKFANQAEAILDYVTGKTSVFKGSNLSKIFGVTRDENGDIITDTKTKVESGNEGRLQLLLFGKGAIKTKDGSEVYADRVYTDANNHYVRILAKHYNKVNPDIVEEKILGSDGNPRYAFSENNYITDETRSLREDFESKRGLLEKVAYVTGKNGMGSRFLTQLKEKKVKVRLKTFINFIEEGYSDKGRDYFDIVEKEDYVSKLVALSKDDAAIPTMADKKKYYFISGFKFNHKGFTLSDGNYKYDQEHINQFRNYFLAEIDAILEAYTHYKKFKGVDDSKLVTNYHIGNNARGEGNGLRFRYIDGAYVNKTNNTTGVKEIVFESFNDAIADLGSVDEIPAKLEEFKTLMSDDAINQILNEVVKNELKYADTLGVVNYKKTSTAKNILLSEELLKQYSEDGVVNGITVRQVIADHAINSMISLIEFEKLYSKDPAYYKSTEDKVKRLSGLLSTGTNLRVDYQAGHELAGKTTYKVMELKDNKTYNEKLYNSLKESYKTFFEKAYRSTFKEDDKLTEEENEAKFKETVDKAVTTKLKALESVNQTDATVFITPTMYKSILMRMGEFDKTKSAAFDRLMKGESLTATDLEIVMQPLKMMSFGGNERTYDINGEASTLDVPIFNKMAMFPIFPTTATGEIKNLYDHMVKEGIEMAAFNSAVKVGEKAGNKTFFDNEGHVNDLSETATHTQDFKNLRRQLMTDPHEEADRAMGTQVFKISLSNIAKDTKIANDIVGLPGKEVLTKEDIVSEYVGATNAISNKGVKNILARFGAKLDESGEYIINMEKLSELLIEDAQAAGTAFEIINNLEIDEETGRMRMPIAALSNSKWIQSRLISMIKKETIDINTAGGSFIQMTPFGIEKLGESEATLQGYVMNDGKKLNLRNSDGSMDCVISINMFKDVLPKGLNFLEARTWLREKGLIGEQSKAVALGYRIPTQAMASIPVLRVADIIESTIGDTIVLPDEFTAISGSDFDIDKIYVARYYYDKDGNKIKFNDEIELKDGKDKWQANSRKANVNRLLDVMIQYVSDESNEVDATTSIDSSTSILKDEIVEDIDRVTENPVKVGLYAVSPQYQLAKKMENARGKSGIAPFALANAHHVISQMVGLTIKSDNNAVRYGIKDLSKVWSDDKSSIMEWLSAMINAHVDMAKDPYITRININEYTYNMTCLLLRAGKGKATFYFLGQQILKEMADSALSFNGKLGIQKGTSKYDLIRRGNEAIVSKYASRAYGLAKTDAQKAKLEELLIKRGSSYSFGYDHVAASEIVLKTNDSVLNKDGKISNTSIDLLKGQLNQKESFDWFYTQLLVAKAYEELNYTAMSLNELVQASQVDTAKFGNNFGLLKSFQNVVNKLKTSNTIFEDVSGFFEESFLDQKLENSVVFARRMFKNTVLEATEGFEEIHDEVLARVNKKYKKNDALNNAVSNGINEAIREGWFNDFVSRKFVSESEQMYGIKPDNVVKRMFTGNNTLVKQLFIIKQAILSGKEGFQDLNNGGKIGNKLLDMLNTVDVSTFAYRTKASDKYLAELPQRDVLEFLTFANLKESGTEFQETLMTAFDELLSHPNQVVKDFAEQLVAYSFYTSGGSINFNSLFEFVPETYKRDEGYGTYFEGVIEDFNAGKFDKEAIIDSVFRSMSKNNDLVPYKAKSDLIDAVYTFDTYGENGVEKRDTYPIVFKSVEKIVGDTMADSVAFQPYYKFDYTDANGNTAYKMYKAISYSITPDEKPVVIYALVNSLGYDKGGRTIKEPMRTKSFIDSNNTDFGNISYDYTLNTMSLRKYVHNLSYANLTKEAKLNENVVISVEENKAKIDRAYSAEALSDFVPAITSDLVDPLTQSIKTKARSEDKRLAKTANKIKDIDQYIEKVNSVLDNPYYTEDQKESVIRKLTEFVYLNKENLDAVFVAVLEENIEGVSLTNYSYVLPSELVAEVETALSKFKRKIVKSYKEAYRKGLNSYFNLEQEQKNNLLASLPDMTEEQIERAFDNMTDREQRNALNC